MLTMLPLTLQRSRDSWLELELHRPMSGYGLSDDASALHVERRNNDVVPLVAVCESFGLAGSQSAAETQRPPALSAGRSTIGGKRNEELA
jgi:hypothetical protein